MKRLLLDTHILLWWLSDDVRLGSKCRELITDPNNIIYVSAATTWEISIKRSLGKLQAPDDMDAVVLDSGFTKLSITLFHGDQAGSLEAYHKDPFDRMLVAQAQIEGLTVVSVDQKFRQYRVNWIDGSS